MAARIEIFDRNGIPLAELSADAEFSSELNKAGKATIAVALSDPKLTKTNLQFRNLILISDSEAGQWGGVIWTNRPWYGDHLQITAYSGEYLLFFRRGDVRKMVKDSGSIFGEIIDLANAPENLQVVRDAIWSGGDPVQHSLKYDNLYNSTVLWANRIGHNFVFVPQQADSNNSLYFLAQWHYLLGRYQNITLDYPFDFRMSGQVLMDEQGDIVNDVLVFGGGSTSATVPISQPLYDLTSIGDYGLIQGAWGNNSNVGATLDRQAANYLQLYKQPRRTFGIEIVNPARYPYCNLGDIVGLRMAGIGFDPKTGGLGTETTVRIRARNFNTATGSMNLTVDEWI